MPELFDADILEQNEPSYIHDINLKKFVLGDKASAAGVVAVLPSTQFASVPRAWSRAESSVCVPDSAEQLLVPASFLPAAGARHLQHPGVDGR